MNRKIPFHELASLLAANCNITPDEAEDFVKNFFDLITQTLVAGETVKIKGVGTFAPIGDADNPIGFTPDPAIADTINAPFALFEPEEVSDTLTDAELLELDEPTQVIAESEPEPTTESTPEPTPEPVSDTANVPDEEIEPETIAETIKETVEVSEPETAIESAPETVVESSPEKVAETVVEPVAETTPVPGVESVPEPAANPVSVPIVEPAPAPTPVPAPSTSAATSVPPVVPTHSSFPEEEPEEYLTEPTQKSGGGFGMGFLIGMLVGLALGACAVYFAIDYIFPTAPAVVESTEEIEDESALLSELVAEMSEANAAIESVKADSVAANDTPEVAPTAPETPKAEEPKATQPKAEPAATASAQATSQSAAGVTKDTVRKGYLLNDMAKKHYGNKCFWVYIYEENKAKIANPNRVSAGLELVIPDPAKYGIDASSQASINAANTKAGKILSKFPR